MNLVAGFAPFILFTILSRLSVDLSLWIAFATAFVVTIRDCADPRVASEIIAAMLHRLAEAFAINEHAERNRLVRRRRRALPHRQVIAHVPNVDDNRGFARPWTGHVRAVRRS